MMGLGPQSIKKGEGFEFKQIHFDNYGKGFVRNPQNGIPTGTNVSNKLVDCASRTNPLCITQ